MRIRAEFWHDAIEQELRGQWSRSSTAPRTRSGSSRQGRGRRLCRLADVPPIVFSEAMRDVDLFVGGHLDRRRRELAGRRPERHDLRRVLAGDGVRRPDGARPRPGATRSSPGSPALAIADRLTLDDRYLRRPRRPADLPDPPRLSGNILMEPRHVPVHRAERGGAARTLFLPFDDDLRLSVILSKALLLAKDKAIKDPSIARRSIADRRARQLVPGPGAQPGDPVLGRRDAEPGVDHPDSRPAWSAPVVGTLRSAEVSSVRGLADVSRRPSRKTSTAPTPASLALRTTNRVLPRSSRPSPLATLTPPVEIGVATPVAG